MNTFLAILVVGAVVGTGYFVVTRTRRTMSRAVAHLEWLTRQLNDEYTMLHNQLRDDMRRRIDEEHARIINDVKTLLADFEPGGRLDDEFPRP